MEILSIQRRIVIAIWGLLAFSDSVFGQIDANDIPAASVTQLSRGAVISDQPPTGWTDTLFVSVPKVTGGTIDQVSTMVIEYAEMLSLVIVARVERDAPGGGYRLDDVAVGLAMRQSENLVVVSGPESSQPVPAVSFVTGQVIRSAAQSLDEMKILARRTTLLLFDSPAVFRIDNRNRSLILRTLVWISPTTGQLAQMVWLLEPDDDSYRPALDQARHLPPPFVEQRGMYVDVAEFNLVGLPSERAFALTQLPPGKPIMIDDVMGEVMSLKRYKLADLAELAKRLTKALR